MYGFYIKGRGWIKTIKIDKVICCRNFADVHLKFKFKTKANIKNIESYYMKLISELPYEIKMVSGDTLIEKRVVPHKKVIYDNGWEKPPFIIEPNKNSYYKHFCSICSLYITEEEYISGDICIHCLKALMKDVEKRYKKMDSDIKESWERAKLMDEI